MPLQARCHRIANQYAIADRFGSISKSHEIAIEQIKNFKLGHKKGYNVLDFGVGNGTFLQHLAQYMPHANFTGIDISKEMLTHAREALDLTTIEGSAVEASRFLPRNSQDLALAHFVNAYIPLNTLFNEANILTRANGYFSLITTTYESFPAAQEALAQFIAQGTLISSVVGHYYKAMVKSSTVAGNLQQLNKAFHHNNFSVVDHQRIHIPITLNNIEDLALFGIDGTWFLNSISMRMLPKNFLLERLKRLFGKIFTFPYQDTHIIDVFLARK